MVENHRGGKKEDILLHWSRGGGGGAGHLQVVVSLCALRRKNTFLNILDIAAACTMVDYNTSNEGRLG